MEPAQKFRVQCIMNTAGTLDAGPAFERIRNHHHVEMSLASWLSTRMPGVPRAVVLHLEGRRGECLLQPRAYPVGPRAALTCVKHIRFHCNSDLPISPEATWILQRRMTPAVEQAAGILAPNLRTSRGHPCPQPSNKPRAYLPPTFEQAAGILAPNLRTSRGHTCPRAGEAHITADDPTHKPRQGLRPRSGCTRPWVRYAWLPK